MRHLNTLWQAASAASTVGELTRQAQTYLFTVNGPVTFFLRAEQAEVKLIRWAEPKIEVAVLLQMPFGWRLVTDQDEVGVYVAASRRPVVGGLASASFRVMLPHDAYVVIHLEGGRIVLEGVGGTVHLAPEETPD